jgi:carbon storage regulator
MLIISRKLGERIVLGENIEITLLQIRQKKVHLGIEAPRHIPVERLEARRWSSPTHQPSPRAASVPSED